MHDDMFFRVEMLLSIAQMHAGVDTRGLGLPSDCEGNMAMWVRCMDDCLQAEQGTGISYVHDINGKTRLMSSGLDMQGSLNHCTFL